MDESMTIDAVSSTEALSDLGLKAIDLFGKVEKALKEAGDEKLPEDMFIFELQRFELWAANMGLFVPGHGSLDYRVREAEKLAQTLRKFMQDLNTSLEDVIEMCSESKQEGASRMDVSTGEESTSQTQGDEAMDEDEDEESWNMDLLVDSVRDPINRLFKMSTKIRNPSTRLGSSRAVNYRQVDEETGVELLQAMKEFDLDYVKSVFLEFRKTKARRDSSVAQPPGGPPEENDDEVWEPIKTVLAQEREQENTSSHSYLIDRIAQANFRRRQQFAYWAAHRDKLDKHTKAYQAQKGQGLIAERQRGGGLGVERAPGPLPSVSSATGLDMARLEISSDTRSNWALSEYAPSTRQAADAPVDFPPAPKVPRRTQTDRFFECPYCFFLCPKEILAEKAWKAHLIHDLRPYICTYEECRNPTQLYDSRKDWVQHENSEHRKVWICPEHSGKVFQSFEAYKSHLQHDHAGSISGEESLRRIVQASESVADIAKRSCPICTVELNAGRSMEGHIALHLERFARFSLPRSVSNGEDDVSNADSDKANRVDEEGSRDNDFDGGLELHSDVHSHEAQSAGHSPIADNSSPPLGEGTTGGILKNPLVSDDDDESSSESGASQGEVEKPTDDEETFDGLKVGEWCTDFEKYEKVEREFREALEQTEKTLGSDHPETLQRMENLESLLRGQRKFEDAEHIMRRILEHREKELGHEHPDTLSCMHDVAYLLHEQGKLAEAEKLQREVLALREKVLGREDPLTLISLANLSSTLTGLGQMEEAEKLARQAMVSREKVLGPSHTDTLTSMGNLAWALMVMGQLDEAEKMGKEAVESHKKVLGPSHADTIRTLSNLASTLSELGRFEEAEKLRREALESRRNVLGLFHPDTMLSMANLADTLENLGQLEGVKRLQAELMDIQKQVLGPGHPSTLSSITKMALILWGEGSLDEAEKLEVEVLEASRQNIGPTNPITLTRMYNLAYTWHDQGHLGKADDLMEECVQLRRQVLGPEHESTLSSIQKLEEWRAELEQLNT